MEKSMNTNNTHSSNSLNQTINDWITSIAPYKSTKEEDDVKNVGNEIISAHDLNFDSLIIKKVEISQLPNAFDHPAFTQNLQYITIISTRITELPPSFCTLTNLKHLNLSRNHFNQFPSVICQLTNLKILNLSSKGYLGCFKTIPEDIGNLTELISLDLSNHDIEVLPNTMNKLSKLRSLYLKGNKIDKVPEWLNERVFAKLEWASLPFEAPDLNKSLYARRIFMQSAKQYLDNAIKPKERSLNLMTSDYDKIKTTVKSYTKPQTNIQVITLNSDFLDFTCCHEQEINKENRKTDSNIMPSKLAQEATVTPPFNILAILPNTFPNLKKLNLFSLSNTKNPIKPNENIGDGNTVITAFDQPETTNQL
jgi:Leucine-rich repeat (LRR) protein